MALAGKVVLVMGGSSGMGKAAAKFAVRDGATVWITGRDLEKLQAAIAEISPSDPSKVKTSSVDNTDDAAVQAFFAGVPAGSIHHLVATLGNSAGCSSIEGPEGMAGLRRQFDFKFFAQLAAVSYGASKLADGGSIVLTSGALAKRPGKGSTALAAANAALDAIARGLALDFGPRLRVNVLSPGLTNTEMWGNMPEAQRTGMLAGFGAMLPLGRAGESDDVGEAIVALLRLNYVTGQVLDCDGGASIRK
jgi:NAD(P)-dependent dehydrogenase (short-subunit alcohol dehydrogenase family)